MNKLCYRFFHWFYSFDWYPKANRRESVSVECGVCDCWKRKGKKAMKNVEQERSLFGISLSTRPKWQQFLICSSGFFFGYLVNGICEVFTLSGIWSYLWFLWKKKKNGFWTFGEWEKGKGWEKKNKVFTFLSFLGKLCRFFLFSFFWDWIWLVFSSLVAEKIVNWTWKESEVLLILSTSFYWYYSIIITLSQFVLCFLRAKSIVFEKLFSLMAK